MLFPGTKDVGAGVEPVGRPDSLLPHPPPPTIGETPERGEPTIGETPKGNLAPRNVQFPFISALSNIFYFCAEAASRRPESHSEVVSTSAQQGGGIPASEPAQ